MIKTKKGNLEKELQEMNQEKRQKLIDHENLNQENQAPNKFAHKSNKEETYEPKKSNIPKSDAYDSYGD